MSKQLLLRVTARHFCAGAVYEKTETGWKCLRAAPILRWIMKKPIADVRAFLSRVVINTSG